MGDKERLIFPVRSERFGLLRMLSEESPLGINVGFEILRVGGITAKKGLSIERTRSGDIAVVKRTFDTSMLAHNAGVCWAANGLSRLIGIDQRPLDLLTASALSHDASKRVEVNLQNNWVIKQKGEPVTDEMIIILDESRVLALASEEDWQDIVNETSSARNSLEFSEVFDRRVNDPFTKEALLRVGSGFSEEEQRVIVEISGASSMTGLQKNLAWALHFGKGLASDPIADDFMMFAQQLKQEGKLPEVRGDQTEFLGMMLWYAEAIVKGDEIVTIEDRYDEVIQRGAYRELHEDAVSFYNGRKYFDVCKLVNHVIERILVEKGVKAGRIAQDVVPEDLPLLVFDNLRERLVKYNKK